MRQLIRWLRRLTGCEARETPEKRHTVPVHWDEGDGGLILVRVLPVRRAQP